jgi:hypothetical protein
MDFMGWFQMSVAEQWGIVFKAIGAVVAIIIALWTVRSWYLSKKIEIENSILEHSVTAMSYWTRFEVDSETQDEKLDAQKYVDQFKDIINEINRKNLGLKRLRKLNKDVFVKSHHVEKYWTITRDLENFKSKK